MSTINPYSSVARDNLSYTPIPFEDILKTGAMKQASYDEGQELADKANLLTKSLNPTEGHRLSGYADEVTSKYTKELQDAYNQHKDLSDPAFKSKVKNIIFNFQADKDIQNIKNSREVFDKTQPTLAKLKSEGAYFKAPWLDPTGKEIPNRANYSEMDYALGDPGKEIDESLKVKEADIITNPSNYGLRKIPGVDNQFLVEGTSTRVTKDEAVLAATKEGLMKDWLTNPNFTADRKRFFIENGNNPKALSDFIDWRMKKYFVDKEENKRNLSALSSGRDREGSQDEDYNEELEDSPFEQVNTNYSNLLEGITKKQRYIYTPGSGKNKPFGEGNVGDRTTTVVARDLNKLSKDEKNLVDNLLTKVKGNTEDEKYDAISKYLTAIQEKKISAPYEAYKTKKANDRSEYMENNYLGRVFLDPSTGKTWSGSQFKKEVIDELKDDDKNIKLKVVGKFTPDNFHTDISTDKDYAERFTGGEAVKLGDKLFVVGMSKSQYESDRGRQEVLINSIMRAKRMGIPVSLGVKNDPLDTQVDYLGNGQYKLTYNDGSSSEIADNPIKAVNSYIEKIRESIK